VNKTKTLCLGEGVDVFHFEGGFGIAALGGVDHGEGDVAEGADEVWGDGAEDGVEPGEEEVVAFDVLLTGCGLHEAGAEVVGCVEGQAGECVFGAAFDASPHGAALFGAVGAGAGDVDEGHLWIECGEGLGEVQCGVVGDVGVVGFAEADGADAGAEEAGVVAGELAGDLAEIHEIGRDGLF